MAATEFEGLTIESGDGWHVVLADDQALASFPITDAEDEGMGEVHYWITLYNLRAEHL